MTRCTMSLASMLLAGCRDDACRQDDVEALERTIAILKGEYPKEG